MLQYLPKLFHHFLEQVPLLTGVRNVLVKDLDLIPLSFAR
jgi:hypothetical protein